MKDIIYFNGDSWADSFLFRQSCYDEFSKNFLIINSAIGGNWNNQIIKSSINDILSLVELSKLHKNKIHAFIFLSELLRSPNEIRFLSNITKEIGSSVGVNACLELMNDRLFSYLKLKLASISNLNLYISTAFTDNNYEPPMYFLMKQNFRPIENCYSVSYLTKFGDKDLLKMGFTKKQIVDFLHTSLARCELLESINGIRNYHVADKNLYLPIINKVKQSL
jgi:hypothetical protein